MSSSVSRGDSLRPLLKDGSSGSGSGSSEHTSPTRRGPKQRVLPYTVRTKPITHWLFTFGYLLGLWVFLFAFSYGFNRLLFLAVEKDRPPYYGTGSFVGGVPVLIKDPVAPLTVKTELDIIWNTPEKREGQMKRFGEIAESLHNGVGSTKCDGANAHHNNGTPITYSCRLPEAKEYGNCNLFDLKTLNASYDAQQPCVMIRLTKILGFYPTPTTNTVLNDTQDIDEKTHKCYEHAIKFQCKVVSSPDKSNSSTPEMVIFPKNGISFCHFPYWNQGDYHQPYVMVQPDKPLPVGQTGVECRPTAECLKTTEFGAENIAKFTYEIV